MLTPVSPGSISRTYARSAFHIRSRLLDANGQPIVGARIDILQQVAETHQTQLVAYAITGADGSFSVLVAAGPSRTIDIAYRAFAADSVYAAQTEVFESVAAGVQLRITPRRTSATGWIVFEGTVLGTVPAHGVVAEVLVDYHGQWQPIRTPRTSGERAVPSRLPVPPGVRAIPRCEYATGRLGSRTGRVTARRWRSSLDSPRAAR